MKKEANKYKTRYKYSRKQLLIACIIIIYGVSLVSILGRYVVENASNFFGKSNEFYFNSDKLDVDNPSYQIENWSGVDNYTITINMNSNDNNLLSTAYDIEYDISYSCSSNIICQLSKEQGTIYSGANTDSFNLVIVPNTQLTTGDRVFVQITAETSYPYEKTLKGRFTLIVGQENISYEIVDEENSPYLELNITNTLSYYMVQEAFDSYNVGEKINIDTYLALSDENKNKCYSTIITLTFDPNDVILDMTNSNYLSASNITNTTVNSYNYINSITFKVEAISSANVRFYKKDETENYTYPITNEESIIEVTNI